MVTPIAALALATAACSKKSPESQAKDIANNVIVTMNGASERLEKAGTGKEAAEALCELVDKMEALKEKSDALSKAHPELDGKANEFMPEEAKRLEEAGHRFGLAMMSNSMKHSESDEFKSAVKKFRESENSDKSTKTEVPASAPEVDQTKVTAVVDFLNLIKFNCGPYTQRYSESQDVCANVYENFIYNKESQTLLFLERSGPIGPDMREYSHSIDVKTAKGLVRSEPYFQQPEVTAVTLMATSMRKSIGTVSNTSEGVTEELDEVQFIVDPQNGPRLKKALEDLLKAHNITLSEY